MRITQGRCLAQRFVDIADEVDLQLAETLLQEKMRRFLPASDARHMHVPQPPLEVGMRPRPSGIPNLPPVPVSVRIYDVGVVAATFDLPLPAPMDPEALVEFSGEVLAAEDAITINAKEVAAELLAAIHSACKSPRVSTVTEDYTVFLIEAAEPSVPAVQFAASVDIARVLLGEPKEISQEQRDYVTEVSFSSDPSNLVVINWNSALVLSPDRGDEIADILEVAGMELVELRAYDEAVGRSLYRLYDEIEHGRFRLLPSAKYQRLSREIMRLFVDVTETTEKVEGSLQWLGDTWLARIHRGAVRVFDIPRWQRQLEHKMELLRQINQLVVDQITTRQSLRLEAAIVALIVIEIVFALFEII